jgi:dipeptidyl aminopeptidase/acylaminoacyl peptidase
VGKRIKQYGTWPSPISAGMLAGKLRLHDVWWDTISETLVWLENRATGSCLVAQQGIDAPRDLTGEDLLIRGQVGYGGGEFTVAAGWAYFAGAGGRLYRVSLQVGDEARARPITPGFGAAASPRVSPDGRWLVFVHTYEGRDALAVVDSAGKHWPRKLAEGSDFYMQPAWHPEGVQLAYITWDHPRMPWEGTELHLAVLKYDHVGMPYIDRDEVIAGDEATAIFQPEFSPDGRLLAYISDQSGYGHLHVYDLAERTHTALTTGAVEHGKPAWVQGMRVYGWTADGRSLFYLKNQHGLYGLWRYDLLAGKEAPITALEDYTHMNHISVSTQSGVVAMIASASKVPPRVISYAPDNRALRIHRRSSPENIPAAQLSTAQPVEWPGHDGETVYGLYYPPASDRFHGEGVPPLIVVVHGGPTSQALAGYEDEAQFFATRGFAVLYVNHRGSTGYGKPYMEKLRGNWGVYDVEDSATGAEYLARLGMVDPARRVIMGGSAGGFTALQSLVVKPGFYTAGVVRYGVANQFMLAQDTHKFEESYNDFLLGPLPQAAELYRERSPLFHADRIVDPLIIFQGTEDKVVPRNQSDSLVESLRARGVPHEYHVYEGEGHGFRKPETTRAYYNSILAFLARHVLYT